MEIILSIDYGFNLIWQDYKDGEPPFDDIPDEWTTDTELVELNDKLSLMWKNFYCDAKGEEFKFKGPSGPEEEITFRQGCKRLIELVEKHSAGKYKIIDKLSEQIADLRGE